MTITYLNIPLEYQAKITAPAAFYLACPENDIHDQTTRLRSGDSLSVEVSTIHGRRRVVLLVNGKPRMHAYANGGSVACKAWQKGE